MHFKVTATSAGNTDTLPKRVGVRAKEEPRSLNVRSVEKDIMTHHHMKIHRQKDGKVVGNEMIKGHKGGKSKGGKGGAQGKGKGKGKKGQPLNEITALPQEEWTSGSWEQWSDQLTPTM